MIQADCRLESSLLSGRLLLREPGQQAGDTACLCGVVGRNPIRRRPISSRLRQTGLQSLIGHLESCDQLTSLMSLEMTSFDHMTLSDQSETAAQFGEAGCLLADA